MATGNERADQLVQEGIELSHHVMEGIRSAQKKKDLSICLIVLALLVGVTAALFVAGLSAVAIPVAAGGCVGLVGLFVFNLKKQEKLRKDLDTLYHYITH